MQEGTLETLSVTEGARKGVAERSTKTKNQSKTLDFGGKVGGK